MKKIALKKLAIVTGVAAAIAAPASQASIIDHPFFRVLGVVIVWGTDTAAGTTPIVSDFVLMNGGTGIGNDIIDADGRAVITGDLNGAPATNAAGSLMSLTNAGGAAIADVGSAAGYLDATDTLAAFTLLNTTDVNLSANQIKHSFYVASNTVFDIQAKAENLVVSGDFSTGTALTLADIGYSLAVNTTSETDGSITWGVNAQNPGTVVAAVGNLSNMATNDTPVFTGTQRTAASVGTIASQSVRFDATYTLGGAAGYDLSMGAGLIEADVTYTIYVP